jgi:hypothetical protein
VLLADVFVHLRDRLDEIGSVVLLREINLHVAVPLPVDCVGIDKEDHVVPSVLY